MPLHYVLLSASSSISYTLPILCNSIKYIAFSGHWTSAGWEAHTLVVMLAHHIVEQQLHVGSAVLASAGICLNRSTPMVCLCGGRFVCICVVLLVSVMCCKQFICSDMRCILQDPAGFLHWFHTALHIHQPDVICAPRILSAGPELLANVQEDLLEARYRET